MYSHSLGNGYVRTRFPLYTIRKNAVAKLPLIWRVYKYGDVVDVRYLAGDPG